MQRPRHTLLWFKYHIRGSGAKSFFILFLFLCYSTGYELRATSLLSAKQIPHAAVTLSACTNPGIYYRPWVMYI